MRLKSDNLLQLFGWDGNIESPVNTGDIFTHYINLTAGFATTFFNFTCDKFVEFEVLVGYKTASGDIFESAYVAENAGSYTYSIDGINQGAKDFKLQIIIKNGVDVTLSDISFYFGYNTTLGYVSKTKSTSCNIATNVNDNSLRGYSSLTSVSISLLIDVDNVDKIRDIANSTDKIYIDDDIFTNLRSMSVNYQGEKKRIVSLEVAE